MEVVPIYSLQLATSLPKQRRDSLSYFEETPDGLTRNKFSPLKNRARHSLAKELPPEEDLIWGILGFTLEKYR